jgi:hypothetical protein
MTVMALRSINVKNEDLTPIEGKRISNNEQGMSNEEVLAHG